VMTLLLRWGADVNVCDERGRSPLALAIRNDNEALVALLLAWGADANQVDDDGLTPLTSMYTPAAGVVTLLLAWGADPDQADAYGLTPLCSAVKNGQARVVALLLGAKATVDLAMKGGGTPLSLAVWLDHQAIVAALLRAGAVVDLVAESEDKLTPMFLAAIMGHEASVAVLLRGGAYLGKTELGATGRKVTPLYMALGYCNKSVAALIHSWTLAGDDPVQRYFLTFSQLPTNLAIVDPSSCALLQLPPEVIRAILTTPPSCRHLSHQVRLCNRGMIFALVK